MIMDQGNDNENATKARSEDNAAQPPITGDKNAPSEIQILDLHAAKPILSYRGRTFTGSWTSTIGTELLLTPPAGASDHPPLRSLILGASTARLACKPATLHPRNPAPRPQQEQQQQQQQQRAGAGGPVIPVYGDATGTRAPQARFLERLAAIKRARGERDAVTTRALEPSYDPDEPLDDSAEEAWRRKRHRDKRRAKEKWATKKRGRGAGRRGVSGEGDGEQ
jgi:hypothetical protein